MQCVCVYHLNEWLSPVDDQCRLKPIFLSSPQSVQSMLHNHPQFGWHTRTTRRINNTLKYWKLGQKYLQWQGLSIENIWLITITNSAICTNLIFHCYFYVHTLLFPSVLCILCVSTHTKHGFSLTTSCWLFINLFAQKPQEACRIPCFILIFYDNQISLSVQLKTCATIKNVHF